MKKIYVVLVLCFMALNSIAQSFQDLKDKKQNNPFLKQGVKLFFRYTHLKGKYTDALSAPTVNIGLRKDKINIGGIRYRFENPYLGDGIFTIARESNGSMKTGYSIAQNRVLLQALLDGTRPL